MTGDTITPIELIEPRSQAYGDLSLRSVADCAPVAIWVCDVLGDCIWLNRHWLEYTGASLGDHIGNGWTRAVHPDDRDETLSVYRTALKTRHPFSLEYRLQRADGEYRWHTAVGNPRMDDLGNFLGFVGLSTDIHDQKTAREREVEERSRDKLFALMVQGAKDHAIFMLDTQGRVKTWNQGAERLKGYRDHEIVGSHFSRFYPDERVISGWCEKALEAATRDGSIEDEGWRVRKDGSRFWANVVITAILDETGEHVGFSKVTRDLTEKRTYEQAVRESRAAHNSATTKLRGVIDHCSNFIGVLDLDGAVLDANRTALSAAGIGMEEIYRKPFWETPWWAHSTELQERLKQSVQTAASGIADHFAATHPMSDGSTIDVEFSLEPALDENGSVSYLIPEGRDVTLRNRRESELTRLNLELARSNQELEQFAYVASHDLQEPLRKIIAFGQMLREECETQLSDDGRHFLGIICDGAERLKQLVSDLLRFSRIDTDGTSSTQTDANACLQAALESLELQIQENNATINYDTLPLVMAESSHLTLLFQNLVGNGLKYRRDVSPVIDVGVRDIGGQYEFAVRDNGIGISRQYYDRVFEIFKRLHGRGEYSGTGIGLALCKRIVDRFDGRIWLESTPGSGSTFFFTVNKVPGPDSNCRGSS